MNIIERYKTLPEAHSIPDSVDKAASTESKAAFALHAAMIARQDMTAALLQEWTEKDIVNAGLFTPRNPRQIIAELLELSESAGYECHTFNPLRRLVRELDCTMEPFIAEMPEPETA